MKVFYGYLKNMIVYCGLLIKGSIMKSLILLVLLTLAACNSNPFDPELDEFWANFKSVFGKAYDSREESARRLIWEQRVADIVRHNLKADMGIVSYKKGLNKYSDLQQCGSCWAFSATGSLEGQHFKKSGKLVSLSEQNLVDCSQAEGNSGCGGGWMDQAFEYVKKNHGIDTEKSYPYNADEEKCHFKKSQVGANCTGYVDIPQKDEKALQKAVATIGPISVAINAGGDFDNYESGVYDPERCPGELDYLNHGVLVVGYGTDNGKDYWIVKNSWGDSFGEKGYIRMIRNKNNACGIATKASYPLV
ncbi:hypothetical protein JTE90_025299 [Oedothorax gibbosus]|uniref:Uncharacterized protein n=1 Tax=Oedothorax gibbosus TaxID=931172 RepID=A0AAV6V8H7_9ARAC|nr:hypothetical protein JTE90_025299 [Oedothorax gibbosus]